MRVLDVSCFCGYSSDLRSCEGDRLIRLIFGSYRWARQLSNNGAYSVTRYANPLDHTAKDLAYQQKERLEDQMKCKMKYILVRIYLKSDMHRNKTLN